MFIKIRKKVYFNPIFSKVMYLNEDQLKAIKSLSDRIDLATKFRTYSEKFSAENYQDPMLQNFFVRTLGIFVVS